MSFISFIKQGIAFDKHIYDKKAYKDEIIALKPSSSFEGRITEEKIDVIKNKSIVTMDRAIEISTVSREFRQKNLNLWNELSKKCFILDLSAATLTLGGIVLTGVAVSSTVAMGGVALTISSFALLFFGCIRTAQALGQIQAWKDPISNYQATRMMIGQQGGVQYASSHQLKGKLVHAKELSSLWVKEADDFFNKYAKSNILKIEDIKKFFHNNPLSLINYVFEANDNSPSYQIANNIRSLAFQPLLDNFNNLQNRVQNELKQIEINKQQDLQNVRELKDKALNPARLIRESTLNLAKNQKNMVISPLQNNLKNKLSQIENSNRSREQKVTATKAAYEELSNNKAYRLAHTEYSIAERRANTNYEIFTRPIQQHFESRKDKIEQSYNKQKIDVSHKESNQLKKYLPNIKEISERYLANNFFYSKQKYDFSVEPKQMTPTAPPAEEEIFKIGEIRNIYPQITPYLEDYQDKVKTVYSTFFASSTPY